MKDNKIHLTYLDEEIMSIDFEDNIITIEKMHTDSLYPLFLCKEICKCIMTLGYEIESSFSATELLKKILEL